MTEVREGGSTRRRVGTGGVVVMPDRPQDADRTSMVRRGVGPGRGPEGRTGYDWHGCHRTVGSYCGACARSPGSE